MVKVNSHLLFWVLNSSALFPIPFLLMFTSSSPHVQLQDHRKSSNGVKKESVSSPPIGQSSPRSSRQMPHGDVQHKVSLQDFFIGVNEVSVSFLL